MSMRAFEGRAELMTKYSHYDTCGCGGTLTYKFRSNSDTKSEIWIKPTMGMFQKFNYGVNIRSGRLGKLKEVL
jgi:hypothetical protein